MSKPSIMHMFTPAHHVSPFDVNMAADAGYDLVVPYTGVTVESIPALAQDAIFSRSPSGVKRTGIFIGGRDLMQAYDMQQAARRAMVPPFEVSVFADPSGAFTTAAALIAIVEQQLHIGFGLGLEGRKVLLLGGTGPVGAAAAVLAAQAGAEVTVASHLGEEFAREVLDPVSVRYGVRLHYGDMGSEEALRGQVADKEVILATARAGVQVLGASQLIACRRLMIAADLNAVPPAGIEGVGMGDLGKPLAGTAGAAMAIGPLAVGNVKFQVMRGLFSRMLASDEVLSLDFRDAFRFAREVLPKPADVKGAKVSATPA